MFAIATFAVLLFAGAAFLPLTVSVFAYAFVEARNRKEWTEIARPAVRLGGGPYRAAQVVPARLVRAPLLVRAAALGCFYWSWFCVLAWLGVGAAASDWLPIEPVVVAGVAVALGLAWNGVRLLRRDPRVVASGRRIAIVTACHATLVVVLAVGVGGCDWSAPASVFGAVSLVVAALVVAALRAHGLLFARPAGDATTDRALPTWLARMLARQAQRRANFLARASHTSAGA